MISRLQDLLVQQAESRSDAPALWFDGVWSSYALLAKRSRQLARRLAAHGQPGDRVAVLAWNCPAYIELIYAAASSGRILVLLNARLAPAELADQLNRAGVSLLFADQDLLAPLQELSQLPQAVRAISLQQDYEDWLANGEQAELPVVNCTDPAWILFTSGTTGQPKGATLSHHSLLAALDSASHARKVRPDDRYLYPFPLFHVSAHNVLLQHRYGAAVALVRSFSAPLVLRLCEELAITTLSLAPTMLAMLLEHDAYSPEKLASVRTIGYGASAIPLPLLQRALKETAAGFSQGYGMTELSGTVAFLHPQDHRRGLAENPQLLRSVGKPVPTVELTICAADGSACAPSEAGEIRVKGEQCMLGYWGAPDATADVFRDGWLHTGDVGRLDDEGYLYIVDRLKDMIISGGENVASREVEDIVLQHRAVSECAVIGLPHPTWGEAVCACVVLSDETSDEDLDRHCRNYLAAYKTPKAWIRLTELPVNATGKVNKAQLRGELTL